MINLLDRKSKECKDIFVRTRKDNTVECYHFTTIGVNVKPPSGRSKYTTFDKCAERIELSWNIGGDTYIYLFNKHPLGFEVVEKVIFDKDIITVIEIETDFANLRSKIVED